MPTDARLRDTARQMLQRAKGVLQRDGFVLMTVVLTAHDGSEFQTCPTCSAPAGRDWCFASIADAACRLQATGAMICFDGVLSKHQQPGTWRALVENASRVRRVAAERIRDELLAMLTGPDPRRALTLLADTGLLAAIAPELLRLRGCAQSPRHHPEGDVWEHTLRMLERMQAPDAALALGVLLHDVGKPETRREQDGEIIFHGHETRGQEIAAEFMHRLAMPNQTQAEVQMLVGQHMRFLHVDRMRKSTLRRFLLQEGFARLLELHRLDAVSSRGDLATWEVCRRELDALAAEKPPVRPLLSGHDLMAMGYAPGPRLGEILAALVDAQLDGAVIDRTGAAGWVRAHFEPPAAGGDDAPPPGPGGPERAPP